ncbi:MAG: DHH family phosphoesterase [Nitrososphaerota archaeon]
MYELFKKLDNTFKKINKNKIAIINHIHGDPDSIGASFVLKNILEKFYKNNNSIIIIPENASTNSIKLLEYFNIEYFKDFEENIKNYILIDVGSIAQISNLYEKILNKKENIIIIDHHVFNKENYPFEALFIINEKTSSASEIILDFSNYISYNLNKLEAEALFAGIYFDTARFSIASKETFMKCCKLIKIGIEPKEIISKLEAPMEYSEKIARLKAGQRAKIYKINEWIIAISHVSAFQSSAAKSLLQTGADIAIVAGKEKDSIIVSLKSKQDFYEKTKLDLVKDISIKIAKEFSGYAGGHSTAAGIKCLGEVNNVLERIIKEMKNKLEKSIE